MSAGVKIREKAVTVQRKPGEILLKATLKNYTKLRLLKK